MRHVPGLGPGAVKKTEKSIMGRTPECFSREGHAVNPGRAQIEHSGPFAAGEYCTLEYIFTAGHPVDDGGHIKIVFPHAADFGTPQFENPREANYCSLSTTGQCLVTLRWFARGQHVRPLRKTVLLAVSRGYLRNGDKVRVVFGDVSGGSPGWMMQTFAARSLEFKTFSDPVNTFKFKEIFESPSVRVVPGKPVKAVCIAPSRVPAGTAFDYYLKLEDRWGNPACKPEKRVHPGFCRAGVNAFKAVDDNTGLSAISNPVEAVCEKAAGLNRYWADFHGQSGETIGTNSIEDYFNFGKNYARLDILCHQGNDFQVSDSLWEKIKEISSEYNEAGRFVSFPGYEWSGNTPLGGDRNVYFGADGGVITRSSRELLPGGRSGYSDSPDAYALFKNLRKMSAARPFVFAHAGGRYADMEMHDGEIEVAVEIHSAWGTFEWLLEDALKLGYRVGVCANSDDHKGRPGASYPGAGLFGAYGGLTCVFSPSLDRENIYGALKKRHFYATTGHRCLVDAVVFVNGSPAGMMGDVVECSKKDRIMLKAAVHGTAPVQSVDVIMGTGPVKTYKTYSAAMLGRKLKVIWAGAETRGRARMVDWKGCLEAVGNPIKSITPVNFYNPLLPVKLNGKYGAEWDSYTSGGHAGLIVEFEKRYGGRLRIDTAQGRVDYDLSERGFSPGIWEFGGLGKRIEICRLPDDLTECSLRVEHPVEPAARGDNPVYLRVNQLDGHTAWTSPVYISRGRG